MWISPYTLGFKGLACSKPRESSLYMQRLTGLQRKLSPQGICLTRTYTETNSPPVLLDPSSYDGPIFGLTPISAFVRASKVSRTDMGRGLIQKVFPRH